MRIQVKSFANEQIRNGEKVMDIPDKPLDKYEKEEEEINYKFNVILSVVLFVFALVACYLISELAVYIFMDLI